MKFYVSYVQLLVRKEPDDRRIFGEGACERL